MMSFLRSQSQTVLIVILVVIGGSFLFYGIVGNVLTEGTHGSNDYGRIDGEDVSVADLYNAIRDTRDSFILAGRAQEVTRAEIAQEAWRQLLLQHEADRLHIEITNQEVIDYVHAMPLFQKDGVYSPELYQTEMTNLQNAFRITPDAFERVLRNSLRAEMVSKALFSGVRASMRDISGEYEKYYGPVQVSVATISLQSVLPTVKVAESDIEAEYKAHPDNPAYRTAEKRQVDYVLLPLSPEQQSLPDKDKTAAIEALGEKALDFALALQPNPSAGSAPTAPDFQAEAKKMGLTPMTTDFFAADAPPSGLPPSPAFNNAAFALTKDDPNSKVVELDNGVAVLHLDQVQPSELRPLAEVQGVIQQQLQQAQAVQTEKIMAQIDAATLQGQVAKKVDFAKAAAALKLPVQTMPMFVPAQVPQSDAKLQAIAEGAVGLQTGMVSQPIPIEGDNSVVILHVDTRAPPDMKGLAAFEATYRQRQDAQLQNVVFEDWAAWQSRQPGTHPPPNLEEYGGVE
jgi:peptidyl-prolyl cis-trans isomerase D